MKKKAQEAQRFPKKLDPRKHTPRHIIITLPKITQENLKSSKRKGVTYKEVPLRLSADFSKKNLAGKNGLERSIQTHKRQGSTSKITLSSKAII